VSSPGSTIIILDSETYPYVYFDEALGWDKRRNRTLAGAYGQMPTIMGDGTHSPIDYVDDFWNSTYNFKFMNLKLVGINTPAYCESSSGADQGWGLTFENCILSNTGATPTLLLRGGNNLSGPHYVKYCTITASGSAVGISSTENSVIIGNTIHGFGDVAIEGALNIYAAGNIVYNCGNFCRVGYPDASALEVYYNTFYNNSGGMTATTAAWNNLAQSCGNPGIGGEGNYNCATNNAVNYSGTIDAEDLVRYPGFVNAGQYDFRLRIDSPCYNTAEPNGTVSGCRGAHTAGVRLTDREAGAVTTYTLTFVPLQTIPSGGWIEVTFPSGFGIAGITGIATTSTWGGTVGGFTWSINGQTLLVMRNGAGTKVTNYLAQNLIITGVTNHIIAGDKYSLKVATREGNSLKIEGDYIDYPRDSNCFEIWPTGLYLINSAPFVNETDVNPTRNVKCFFNTNIDNSTVNSGTIYLQDSDWNIVDATYTVSNNVIKLDPTVRLQPNEYYTVTLTTNLETTLGRSLSFQTQLHFYTAIGLETGHEHHSITVDGALDDWNVGNNVTYNTTINENLADDADSSWGETDQLWATWDTEYLYIGIKKAVASADEWYDYIAIDTTRDYQGATNNPGNVHNFDYNKNRLPEYLLRYNHDDVFSLSYVNDWRIYKWDGSSWNQGTIPSTNRANNGNEIVEVRIPWTTFGEVPNRIAIANYSYYLGGINDFCPENISGPTNWITIDPDNNGDEVADGAVPPPPVIDIKITKYADSVTIGSTALGPTNVLPGSTIAYEIAWTNRGDIILTNVVIYDKIPAGTYQAGTLQLDVVIGDSSWEEQWSDWVNPDQTYDSTGYVGAEPVPASSTKWVRARSLSVAPGESGYMRFNIRLGSVDAGTFMPNTAFVTCKQALVLSSNTFNITIATQFGGSFSLVSDITGAQAILDGTNYFDVFFTNKGNSTADFQLEMPYTNSSVGLALWDIDFVTNDVPISSINNLTKGGVFSFQVRIITTNSGLTGGNWLEFRIRAQAENDTTATNYLGDDGLRYGGTIGEDWNGVNGVNPGYIYNQGNTKILLKLQGAAPELKITKSVSNITWGGVPVSKPIPGASITYIITYSNAGDASASMTTIFDGIPANTKYITNYALPSATSWTSEYTEDGAPDQSYSSISYSDTYTAKSNITFVRWKKPLVGAGEKGEFIYKVIIK